MFSLILATSMLSIVAPSPSVVRLPAGGFNTTANEVQKLLASDGSGSSVLGIEVSLADGTAAISAPRHNNYTGAVYIFERSGAVWTEVQRLAGASFGEQFGCTTDLQSDTLAVGAFSDDVASNAGSVYVFVRSGGTWVQQALIYASDATAGDGFGNVALDGDRIVVGAVGGDDANPSNQETNSGSAYVLVRNGSTWTEEAKLVPSDTSPGDFFGSAVAIEGDTIVVGAFGDNDGAGPSQGSAYVFTRMGSAWVERQKLFASDPGIIQWFGETVALRDGTLLIGAPGSSDGGAVHAFGFDGAGWVHQQRFSDPLGACCSSFGRALDFDGDFAVIGAPATKNGNGAPVGAAYVFSRPGTAWTETWQLQTSVPLDPADGLGFSVAIDRGEVLLGAPCDDDLGVDAGAMYVFRPGLPSSYCTGKTNSLGCIPFMTSSGLPSVTNTQPFRVIGNDALPSEGGVLLYGFSKANLSFHGARLCIKAPITRWLPVKKAKNTGSLPCSGTHSRNFNGRIQSGIDPSLTMGKVVRTQWLLRDPSDPTGFFGDGLTDGLQFTIQP